MNNQRIYYLDIAKGILILLLCLSHFGSATRRIGIENEYFNVLYNLQPYYASFFMQCFFIISGLCSNFNCDYKSYFTKAIKQIIIPWISFEVIVKILWAIYLNKFSYQYLIEEIHNITLPPNTGLWFFSALFVAKTFTWATTRFINNRIVILGISLILLFISLILNQYKLCPNYLAFINGLEACFFVYIGYLLKKKSIDNILKINALLYPMLIIFIKTVNLSIPILDAGVSNVGWKYFPIIILSTLSGSFCLLYLCKQIKKNKLIEYFGKNSIIIYGIHFIPLMYIISILYKYPPTNYLTMIMFIGLTYIMLLVFLLLIIKLFNTKHLKWICGK